MNEINVLEMMWEITEIVLWVIYIKCMMNKSMGTRFWWRGRSEEGAVGRRD